MVSNASEDLPDPDRQVKAIRASRGRSSVTFLRLCSRAPCTTRRSVPMAASVAAPADMPRACGNGSGHPRLAQLAKLLPQLVDLVAKTRRVLEPQVLGRLVHLLLETLDEPAELLGG